MDALADAVCARERLCSLEFLFCTFPPADAPALARAVRDGALAALIIDYKLEVMDAAGAAVLGDALRASTTLTLLSLPNLPRLAGPAAAALLGALVGHHSLQSIRLTGVPFEDPAAAGALLAALLAADAPALTELQLRYCHLGEAGLGAVCDALRSNTHLRVLDIRNNRLDAAFMRDRLLPAVRANTSLRTLLLVDEDGEEDDAMLEARRIVAAR